MILHLCLQDSSSRRSDASGSLGMSLLAVPLLSSYSTLLCVADLLRVRLWWLRASMAHRSLPTVTACGVQSSSKKETVGGSLVLFCRFTGIIAAAALTPPSLRLDSE